MLRYLLCLLPLLYAAPLFAECSASSGDQRVSLVELYTSEGCSSCPPADQWLSGLAAAGYGADQVVPLAFHVDYWDYIGWKDRFAKPEFSARQRKGASSTGFVYTPQVKLNGMDLRGWQRQARFARALADSAAPARVRLQLALKGDEVKVTGQIPRTEDRAGAELYIAIYENGLSSQVATGENSGRHLRHDYVVRELQGPYPLAGGAKGWQRDLPLKPEWQRRDAGVVAFVQQRANGAMLQALRLPLCGKAGT